MAKKKYLFVTMCGLGYLYPSIRLAHILQANFHQVVFLSTIEHNLILSNYGIEHIPVAITNRTFLDLHRWGHPEKAQSELKALNSAIKEQRPDVIVTSPLAMISFVIAEKYQIPIINIGFCEYLFPGKIPGNIIKEWRIKSFTNHYNSYRAAIGLLPIECLNTESPLIGTKYLLRSVPELNDDIVLPDQVVYIGDMYLEPKYFNKPLLQFIANSKAVGRVIAYIQMGRFFKDVHVWESLVKTLSQLSMDFIVDIGRADYLAEGIKMPDNFFSAPFIPIGSISNDIEFVICSGQTTSIISAIIHSKQILTIPHSGDSEELTARLEPRKLALSIPKAENINVTKMEELFHQLEQKVLLPSIQEYRKFFLAYTDDMIYDSIRTV